MQAGVLSQSSLQQDRIPVILVTVAMLIHVAFALCEGVPGETGSICYSGGTVTLGLTFAVGGMVALTRSLAAWRRLCHCSAVVPVLASTTRDISVSSHSAAAVSRDVPHETVAGLSLAEHTPASTACTSNAADRVEIYRDEEDAVLGVEDRDVRRFPPALRQSHAVHLAEHDPELFAVIYREDNSRFRTTSSFRRFGSAPRSAWGSNHNMRTASMGMPEMAAADLQDPVVTEPTKSRAPESPKSAADLSAPVSAPSAHAHESESKFSLSQLRVLVSSTMVYASQIAIAIATLSLLGLEGSFQASYSPRGDVALGGPEAVYLRQNMVCSMVTSLMCLQLYGVSI